MLPFTYETQVCLPFSNDLRDQIVERLLTQFRINLEKERAQDICQTGQQITFTRGFFSVVSKWDTLYFIDKGAIEVMLDGGQVVVSYRLWFVSLSIIAISGICVGGIVALLPMGSACQVLFVSGFSLFLYVFYFFGAVERFSVFVQDAWQSVAGKLPDEKHFA
jgi:hypothetical protein